MSNWWYLWCCHHGSEPFWEFCRFTWWMQTQCQMSANTQTKSNNLCCKSAGSYHSHPPLKGKGSPYSITEHRVPELISVLGSQPAGDVSHKPGGRLPLISARPTVSLATLKRAATNFAACWTEARWVWTVCLRPLLDSVAAETMDWVVEVDESPSHWCDLRWANRPMREVHGLPQTSQVHIVPLAAIGGSFLAFRLATRAAVRLSSKAN